MRMMMILLALMLATVAGAAQAKDTTPCAAGLICASKPGTVVAALQEAGYKAKLTADNGGDPMIETSASGYYVDVFFYGCDAHASCDSIQFRISMKKDAKYTVDFANTWNRDYRFFQASITKDGELRFCYDVSTVGGLTKANMADVMSWIDSSTSWADKFVNGKAS